MSPGFIITPALLSSIRSHPHLPAQTWYFVAGATLSSLNLPHEIPRVLKYVLERGGGSTDVRPGYAEQLEIARKMREALIKTAPICGLPKVLRSHSSSMYT